MNYSVTFSNTGTAVIGKIESMPPMSGRWFFERTGNPTLLEKWLKLSHRSDDDSTAYIQCGTRLGKYRLTATLAIEIESSDEGVIATCGYLDLAVSGETREEAIEFLESRIIETHAYYQNNPTLSLGKRLEQQRRALQQSLAE